eukprot:SAG11_NODE_23628_length_385_cov_1.062937_1_plen_34_part_01
MCVDCAENARPCSASTIEALETAPYEHEANGTVQ